MIRIAIGFLLFVSGIAYGVEAGRVVFATGDVRVAGQTAELGGLVQEGDSLKTGSNGYLYIKTIDNGFFILRPGSVGRIVTYRVDAQKLTNSRIKLELQEGVARHISGDAAKAARRNFRMNTPVAAIGVVGTDFTVFTNSDYSRVMVTSGGIVVSPFSGACRSESDGPCEGASSLKLLAAQVGQIVQVSRGQVAPLLLQGNGDTPDHVAPPRNDEPGSGKRSGVGEVAPVSLSLLPTKASGFVSVVAPEPAADLPKTDTGKPVADVRQLIWGRWQVVLGQEKELDLVALQQTNELIAASGGYALMRNKEGVWQRPEQNLLGFSLQNAQAVIRDESSRRTTVAGVENGTLQVDFAKSTFSTQFELVSQSERFKLQAQGSVTADGRLDGNNQFLRPTNMAVTGVLNKDNASAAYLFSSRLDETRVAEGVTSWVK